MHSTNPSTPGRLVDHGAPTEARLAELEGELAELAGVLNATYGALVRVATAAIEEGVWEHAGGIHSPAQWLAWRTGLSTRRARQVVAVAERGRELPVTVAALAAGELSIDQARVVAAHTPAAFDASVTELAKQLTVAQLERNLPDYCFDGDGPDCRHAERLDEPGTDAPDGNDGDEGTPPSEAPDEAAAPPSAAPGRASWWWDDHGVGRLSATFPTDEGLVVEAAMRAARADLHAERRAAVAPGAALPWISEADVLVQLARSYLANGAAGNVGTDRYTLFAHLRHDRAGRPVVRGQLGPVLPGALASLVSCDAAVRPVWEVEGRPLSVGRTQRIVPDRTRRIVEQRDGGCIVPGCLRRSPLDVHHIVHWEDGGPTDTANLCCLCHKHHRQHHLGLLGITGDADASGGLTVTDRFGRRLDQACTPTPLPPGQPLLRAASVRGIPTSRYRPGPGERLDRSAVHLNPRPPVDPRAGPAGAERRAS